MVDLQWCTTIEVIRIRQWGCLKKTRLDEGYEKITSFLRGCRIQDSGGWLTQISVKQAVKMCMLFADGVHVRACMHDSVWVFVCRFLNIFFELSLQQNIFIRDYPGEPVPEETFRYPDHQPSFISCLHLLWSIASFLFFAPSLSRSC